MVKDFESLKKIVNEYDPVQLLDSASDNEYDSEVRKIVSLLSEDDDINSIADKVHKIFVDSFDEKLAGDKDTYLAIAKKILV